MRKEKEGGHRKRQTDGQRGETERDRQIEGQTETDIHRQTDTDTDTDRQTER